MKKRILSMILALVLVVGIMPTATFASIGEDEKHLCDALGSYCLVCEVAEKINALPAKDDINVNNAAMVIEDIHAIDRIKFDLTDEEYEELLTLVENENYAPARYFDAVDAIKELEKDYSSFVAVKSFSSESGNVDVSNASVKFKVTNTETGASQTLTMSTMPYQLGSLSADADFYSANSDGSGWSYKYILPAGNYKIEGIDDSGATVDGEPFVTGSTFCSVDGSEETEGKTAAFTVEDGGNTVVTFDNVLPGGGPTYYTVTFDANGGTGDMAPEQILAGGEFILPECGFNAPADAEFVAWEVNSGEYEVGASITIDGDTTVTAVWKKYYNITFNSNGGTGEMDSERILEGVDFVLPECEFNAPAGTEFRAWEIDDGEYSPGDLFYLSEDAEESSYDIEIKALWDNYYTVTFDANGGTGNMAPKQILEDEEFMLPACEFTPPGDYSFKCWEIDEVEYDLKENPSIYITGNVTVKAKWGYTVRFMNGTVPFAEINFDAGDTLGMAGMPIPDPRDEFYGWCTEDNFWVYHGRTVNRNLTAYAVRYTAAVTGDPKVGETLTADINFVPSNSAIVIDTDTLSYQWMRGTTAISGATNKTYNPTNADVGQKLKCIITVPGGPRNIEITSETIEADVFPVTVENGTADKAEAKEGETVRIIANSPATGKIFSGWTSNDVTFENASAAETAFVMPAKAVTVTANYSDCDHKNNTNNDDDDCTTEVICSVCSGTAVAANSHNYSGATYEWSTDGKSCVAKRSCQNDGCKASETATATITSNEKTSATCTEMGTTTYTATFNADWATEQTKDVQDIPAIEHDWSVEYEWSADGKSCKAIRVCGNDAKHNISEEATVTSAEKTSATCSEMGTTTYTATFNADWATTQTKDVQDIQIVPHDWNDTTYEWSTDGKSCVATRTCKNYEKCNGSETATATITSNEKTPATCTEMGTTTYTATFTADWATEQTKDIQDIPATKHDWSVEYEWSADGKSCKAIRVCGNDEKHNISEEATVTSAEKTPATCSEMGTTTYTATFTADWATEQTKDVQDIQIVPHDWNDTTYEWSTDGKSCVATRTCKNYEKCNGSETATATITSAEKTSATCTEMGTTTYTATFNADWATEQTKDIQDIPATRHDWSVEYEWSADGKSCKAIRVCGNDEKHNISEEATVTSAEKISATCTEMGTTTYTATFTADWATTQTKDVKDIPATKHDWNETTYEWSADGKSCKAIRVCGNNEEHVETAIATVKGKVVKKATCIEKGDTLYTATFNVDWAAEQTKTITDIEIDADNHNVVIDKASDPTCTETGLTEGKHCSACKKILVEQQTIKALGHDYGRWVKVYEPTETEPGVKVKTCHNCGKKIYADIAPLSKDGIEELGPGAGKPETGTETNPNTGAPALVPFAAAFAILSGAVVFKKKK